MLSLAKTASNYDACIRMSVLGNAIGNSIVDRATPTPMRSSTRNTGAELDAQFADDLDQSWNNTLAGIDAELSNAVAPSLDVNPSSAIRAGSEPDPDAVRELQAALAREEQQNNGVLRSSLGGNVSNGTGAYRNENGTLVIPITRGANDLPRSQGAAPTNASIFGITDEAMDADIAAGKTSTWDALSYAGRKTGYEAWNFLTGGFVERHDARLTAEANGQLSSGNFWNATALDAAGSVGSMYLGGRAGGAVMNRLGGSYTGYAASGAAAGGVFDLTQQGTQLGINALTGGQTGQTQFAPGSFVLATGGGALAGGALRGVDGLNTAWVNRSLAADLANQEYVYRGTSEKMLQRYIDQGNISGQKGVPTYFSLEGGATPLEQRLNAQLGNTPEVLLKIPVSALQNQSVPRPLFGRGWIGREYTVNSYPDLGAGGYRQFTATTNTFSEDWIVQGWGKR